MIDEERLAERLVSQLAACTRPVVAFSGGVDSALVAKAAYLAHGRDAVAVTAIGPAVAADERVIAERVAHEIGIRHELLATHEWRRPAYRRNAPDRCFHCKSELYGAITAWLDAQGESEREILSGANQDDLGDYRPGLQAASDFRVRHPLVECRLGKESVRRLARYWQLPVWDKPASPCLASRIAYGVEVTPDRLRRIEAAESILRERGFAVVRVRLHADDLARIEVPRDELGRLVERLDERLVERLKQLGFRRVTVDLEGYRSGSLNEFLPVDMLARSVAKATADRDT